MNPTPPTANRLLVVDDELSVRESVGYALEQEGFNVTLAADGEEAEEKLSKKERKAREKAEQAAAEAEQARKAAEEAERLRAQTAPATTPVPEEVPPAESAMDRPEVMIGIAFAGAFIAARVLKRIFD